MKELKELTDIVAKNRIRNFDLLNNINAEKRPGNSFLKLYHAIREGRINNDEDASRLIYRKKPDSTFRSLKTRLRSKLLNTLLFMDLSAKEIPDYIRAEYLCSRLQHCVRILQIFGARKTASQLNARILLTAQKYELAEFVLFAAKTERNNYAFIGNPTEFERYDALYRLWSRRLRLEEKARYYLDKINIQYSISIALRPELSEGVFKFVDYIEKENDIYKTVLLQIYCLRIKGLAHQIAQRYEESILAWDEMEILLNSNIKLAGMARLAEASLNKMLNFMYLRQHTEALQCAEKCRLYYRTGSNNWFTFMEYYYLLCMQSGAYSEAGQILQQVKKNQRFLTMPVRIIEKWKIFEGYFFFLNKTNPVPGATATGDFKVNKFINEIVLYYHDKEGFNISVLILQICFLLMAKDTVKTSERLDSLKIYKKRYLNKDINVRINVFIQMLLDIELCDYKSKRIREKTSPLLDRLYETSNRHLGNMEGVEVIPFERLWEIIIKLLH